MFAYFTIKDSGTRKTFAAIWRLFLLYRLKNNSQQYQKQVYCKFILKLQKRGDSKMINTNRCLYNNEIKDFLNESENSILGILSRNYHGTVQSTQTDAWLEEIIIIQNLLKSLNNIDGQIIFEYDIPRLGKRIDVTLLINGIIFCLEFKVGESRILEADVDQVLDYALDLKYFHKFSSDKIIVPILIATNYKSSTSIIAMSVYNDKVVNPLVTGKDGLLKLINEVLVKFPNETSIDNNWVISPYAPTPTIIEAAKALYKNHSVENITRHEADDVFIDRTIAYILTVIKKSKENKEKVFALLLEFRVLEKL